MLSKILRYLAIGLVSLILLIALAAVVLPFIIPVDKIKTIAAEKASEFLQRPVTIQKASFNLFKGIELTGVNIGERPGFSQEAFVSAGSVELRANLLQLIFGKLSLDGIKLVRPSIKIERNTQNLSNYQDIMDRLKGKEETPKKELSFTIRSVDVENGEFKLIEHFKGEPDQVRSFRSTDISVQNLSPSMKGVPLTIKTLYVADSQAGVPLGLEGQAVLDMKGEKLALYNLVLDVNKEKLFGNVELNGFSERQQVTFDLNSDKLDVEKISAPFISGGRTPAAPEKPQPLAVDIPKTISVSGKLNLNKIKAGDRTIDKINATLRIADQKMNLEIQEIALQDNSVQGLIQGDFTRASEPRFFARIDSNRLDLNALMGESKEATKKPVEGELTRSVNEAASKLPANLKLQAQVKITNLYFKKLTMDQLTGNFSLANKFLSGQINARGYQGTLSMAPTVDFTTPGLGYSLDNVVLNNFESQKFINDLVESLMVPPEKNRDLKDRFSGALSGTFSFSGSGVETQAMLSNLQGSGKVNVTNGTLKKLKALESIAPLLNNDALRGDIAFTEMKGDFVISKGVVTVSSLVANAEKAGLRAEFNGKADLVGQKYLPGNDLNLKLSPQNTTRIPASYNIFKDKTSGWTIIDFELTGPLAKPIPVPKLEKAPIVEQEKQRIQQEIQKSVDTEKQRLEDEAKKKLKDLIKF